MNGLWESQRNTIKNMARMGIKIAVRTTIMRENYGDVLQLIRLVELLRQQGVSIVWEGMPYLPYHNPDMRPTKEQMKMIYTVCLNKEFCRILTPEWTCIYPYFRDKASKWWNNDERLCEAGRPYGRIAIKEDGTILPCPFETKSVGKYIREMGQWFIDMDSVKKNLIDYLDSTPIDENCKKCRFSQECRGGCRIVNNLGHEQICPIQDLWR